MKTTITIAILLSALSALMALPLFADSRSGSSNILSSYNAISSLSNFLPTGAAAYGSAASPLTASTNMAADTIDDTCFNNTQISGADPVPPSGGSPNGTSTAPYALVLKTSGTAILNTTTPTWWVTNQSATTVPYSGYYYITVNLILEQFEANTVYYWVDDWAATAAGTYIRLFYSGDVPYTLNGPTSCTSGGTSCIFTVSLSGGAYLPAGSTIYAPRVWTTQYDPLTTNTAPAAPAFCILNSNGTPASYSSISATLVKSP